MKIPLKSLNERRDEIDLSSSPSASQMRSKLTSTALASDRFVVSDRAAVVNVSSILDDLGMISEKDTSKDTTIFQEKIGTKIYRRIRKEEHIGVIREPGGQYVGHVTPASGTGSDKPSAFLSTWRIMMLINGLEAIGCDGTATNTG
ncbi:hypothetical protein AVEN_74601-1 [Araneus ventricosus]|uniref:Uncharacterized protein n=1 Tax=Araneus ventricosus TaxID=182803 RepID=A0A4Y2QNJ2_ARAVE|nr:hypothetical protein AVEN_192866-1 [Araneus ventricosus]GBN64848.1 hypothetical protein AVEN_74601-1 [Araneus ventricosus]